MWAIIIIVCIAVAIGIYKLKKWNDECVAYEQKRQEEALKKKKKEAEEQKKKENYKRNLKNKYAGLSRRQLEQIYPLLKQMHRSDYYDSEPETYNADLYFEANRQLKSILGESWDVPPGWVFMDMNYVYELLNY